MKIDNKGFKIFVDFDGTITRKDVGEEMFLTFGNPEKAHSIIKQWLNKEITSIQTWQYLCETVVDLNMKDFDEFIDKMEIDPYFLEFVDFCNSNGHEIRILSDGLDYYIERILKNFNIQHIEHYTNKVKFGANNKLICEFPYTDEECNLCANCKRNHILENSADDDFTVYIGDGWSDTCAAQYCDVIFAKRSLLKFCEKNRISYFPFTNFKDVIKRLEDLGKKKRLKKRHQAFLKRREVYMQG